MDRLVLEGLGEVLAQEGATRSEQSVSWLVGLPILNIGERT